MPRIKAPAAMVLLFFIFVLVGTLLNKSIHLTLQEAKDKQPQAHAQEAYNKCAKSLEIQRCYTDFFIDITKKRDITYTGLAIQELMSINPEANINCHLMAHKVSRTELEKNPLKWKDILKKVSLTDCTGGYLHGTLEAYIGQDPDFVISSKTINSICDNLELDVEPNGAGCHHTMGHLLLVQNENNLPSTTKECNKLDDISRHDCLMGTFMEYIVGENLLTHGILKKLPKLDEKRASEIENLCIKYSGPSANACWRQIAHIYASISSDVPEKLYTHCSTAPEKKLREACYLHGVGVISNQLLSNSKEFYKICSFLGETDTFFGDCIHSSVTSILSNSADKSLSLVALCDQTRLKYQQICYDDIITTLKRLNAGESTLKSTCLKIPRNGLPKECRNYLSAL